MTDRRHILADEAPFACRFAKDGKAFISWRGKPIMTLTGAKASALIKTAAGGDPTALQLALAKATGHFKHGNERRPAALATGEQP